jgi:hypothetical protein
MPRSVGALIGSKIQLKLRPPIGVEYHDDRAARPGHTLQSLDGGDHRGEFAGRSPTLAFENEHGPFRVEMKLRCGSVVHKQVRDHEDILVVTGSAKGSVAEWMFSWAEMAAPDVIGNHA